MLERIDRYWPVITLLVVLACAGLGCGQAESTIEIPELVPVTGTLLVDGQPEEGVSITFVPQGTTEGQVAYAVTDPSGAFSCKYNATSDGCPQGTYAVMVSKLVTPDGKPIPEGANAADVMAVNKIPGKYRDMSKPFQVVEVTSTGLSGLKLELKTN